MDGNNIFVDTTGIEICDLIITIDFTNFDFASKKGATFRIDIAQDHTHHDFGDWEIIKEPSCKESGLKVRSCSGCSKTETEVIPTLEHTYQMHSVSPTCSTKGYVEYICTKCGDSFINEYIDALMHTFDDNGTCTACGINDIDYVQSKHDYDDYTDQTWEIKRPNATTLSITFSEQTELENSYDRIIIYDADDKQLGTFTGTELAGKKLTINSDTIKIRLVTDGSVSRYGFSLTNISFSNNTLVDLDGNGKLDIRDVTLVLKYIADIQGLTKKQVAMADVDNDKDVSVLDATLMQKIIAGIETFDTKLTIS